MTVRIDRLDPALPRLSAVLELLKPITWFAPIWAFGCGVVSAHYGGTASPLSILAGLVLAGPFLCGTSQAVNDWFDRGVDAINEPDRPIPSGRLPGAWGLYIAVAMTLASLGLARLLGLYVLVAACLGMSLAWAYSAPPLRLKRNGWWGNAAVGLSYEGLAWITGAALAAGGLPGWRILTVAALYSLGAHGIMTLNDFKSIEGDKRMGLGSLPVRLGAKRAAQVACVVMAAPQVVVIALVACSGKPLHSLVIAAFLAAQLFLMRRLLIDPRQYAPWYNATGTGLYVLGMLVTALAIASSAG